jgi:hypothetical protein
MAQRQIHTQNRTLPSTIINMKEHYRVVSFLFSYSQFFFAFFAHILGYFSRYIFCSFHHFQFF